MVEVLKLDSQAISLTYVSGPTEGVKADFATIKGESWGQGQVEELEWGWLNPSRSVALMKKDMNLAELMKIFNCQVAYYLGRWRFNRRKGRKDNNFRIEFVENGRRRSFKYQINLLKPCIGLIGREVDIFIIKKERDDFGILVLSNENGTLVIAPTNDFNAHYALEDLARLVMAPQDAFSFMCDGDGWLDEVIERWARELGVIG